MVFYFYLAIKARTLLKLYFNIVFPEAGGKRGVQVWVRADCRS